jgi:DNA-binding protein HU-beta
VNKAEFIEVLATHFDGNKAEAARALNAVTQTITYQTASGEKVTITGFGVFEKVNRSARMVRNPRTGERKRAKATAIPRFRAGTDLKAYVSGAKKVPRASKKVAAASKTVAPAAKTVATKAAPTKKAAPAKAAPAKTTAAKTTAAKTTAAKTTAKKTPAKSTAAKTTTAKSTTAAKKATPAKKTTAAKRATAKR